MKLKEIYLAGGCFWGVEAYFQNLKGVVDTNSGYANSLVKNPSYEQVCSGRTGASEAIWLKYDSDVTPLDTILEHYFRIIDPHSLNKQGNDVGTQYRTGIYYLDNSDKLIVENYINTLSTKLDKPIVVEVMPLENYFKAEEYHQDYLTKNPSGYCHIDLNLLREDERK